MNENHDILVLRLSFPIHLKGSARPHRAKPARATHDDRPETTIGRSVRFGGRSGGPAGVLDRAVGEHLAISFLHRRPR